MKTLDDAAFEFMHGETREQKRQRQLAIYQSAVAAKKPQDPSATHFEFLAMKIVNQRGQR